MKNLKNSFGRGFSFPLHTVIIKESLWLKVKARIFKYKNLKFKQKRFICATTYIRNPIWS